MEVKGLGSGLSLSLNICGTSYGTQVEYIHIQKHLPRTTGKVDVIFLCGTRCTSRGHLTYASPGHVCPRAINNTKPRYVPYTVARPGKVVPLQSEITRDGRKQSDIHFRIIAGYFWTIQEAVLARGDLI